MAARFAPSPTSDLHIGNLRTALLAWLYARAANLAFYVRIEDLDQCRILAAPSIAQQQLHDLATLGLDWDGPVLKQSERFELYRGAAATLPTYECFCTRREVAEATQAPHGSYRPYPGTCANLSLAERKQRRLTRMAAIRVHAAGARFSVHDRFAGVVTRKVDDFVLIRNDGLPAYNLAAVVDDGLQRVTQVTRGADLIDSAPRQAWLATKLGFDVSEYIHVGMAVNSAGQRLAKRDGAVTLRELTASGHSVQDVYWMLTDSLSWPRTANPTELLAVILGEPTLLNSATLAAPWVVKPNCSPLS
ncbi:MAG: tRNA glutamyl-Q(34) synthetase GluQRS [Propionibacteriaceae bacterium]|jgi:glutamyl-tRNA synthetase|nr:tRNA glutamyl-Q(34) synthetase GluQRS [Propionibacteriaceae bacterium]